MSTLASDIAWSAWPVGASNLGDRSWIKWDG
jgi:hypothetical protein